MEARVIKQAGQNGVHYWAISVRASDGTHGLFKLDVAEYNQMRSALSDLTPQQDGELDAPVKTYFDMIASHINQRNRFLEAVYQPGGFVPNRDWSIRQEVPCDS